MTIDCFGFVGAGGVTILVHCGNYLYSDRISYGWLLHVPLQDILGILCHVLHIVMFQLHGDAASGFDPKYSSGFNSSVVCIRNADFFLWLCHSKTSKLSNCHVTVTNSFIYNHCEIGFKS